MSTNENLPLQDHSSSDRRMATRPSALVETSEAAWGASGEYAQVSSASTANLVPYLHGLRRHWVLSMFLGILCGTILGLAVYFGWGPQYAPAAFLHIATNPETIVFDTADKERVTEYVFDIYKDTQRQLVTSPLVLTAALRDTKVNTLPSVRSENNADPVAWLQKELRVSFPGEAQIMQVSLQSRNPEEATALVNAVVSAYIDKVVNTERVQRQDRLSELDRIYTEKDAEVRRRGNELRSLAKNLGADEPEALALKQRMKIQELADYQRQLSQITFELNRAKSGLQLQQALLANVDNMEVSQLELDQYAQADPVIREMSKELASQRLRFDYTQGVARPGSASRHVSQHEDDMFRVQAQLEEMSRGLRESILNTKRAEIQQELQRYEIESAVNSVERQSLEQEVARLRLEMASMSGSFIDLEMGRASIAELTGVLADIAKEREALGVEVKARPRINVLQLAEPPKSSVNWAARIVLSLLVMAVGLCIPGSFIVWWDVRAERINSSDDVSKGLGLTVIGSMPLIPARVLRQLGTAPERHRAWHMRLTEAVDGTVARLLRQAELEQRRVILVTSPTGGEGKTTLATQLALSLTRNGRGTVLVDFDLRQPALDQAFGLPLEPGISEVLRQENTLADVIQSTGTDNLSVVPAGRWDRQALAALANGAAGPIFDSLREEAEFVVIDASAVLPVADTRFVSQHVDMVLLSIFRDISQSHKIEAACEILRAFGVESIEAVVTCPTDHLRGRSLSIEAGHLG